MSVRITRFPKNVSFKIKVPSTLEKNRPFLYIIGTTDENGECRISLSEEDWAEVEAASEKDQIEAVYTRQSPIENIRITIRSPNEIRGEP